MAKVIDMKEMRYLNLFEKITHIRTRFCFDYNNAIVFGVPKPLVSKSIGPEAQNLRKINGIIGRRIKVVPLPQSTKDIKMFIEKIVAPVEFKDIDVKENEVILTAGSRNKAALIGRNKRRLIEMQGIIHDFFGKQFRII
jgi:transcription antitermination factor NusA-like protein